MEVLPVNVSDRVSSVIDRYGELLDELAPGAVEGVYVVGSVALGDYHPGASDIDLVGLLPGRPDGATVRALRSVHAALDAERRERDPLSEDRTAGSRGSGAARSRRSGSLAAGSRAAGRTSAWPVVDAQYVTAEDLVAPPERGVTVGIRAHGARLVAGAAATPSPVLWQELAGHGLDVWGTPLQALTVAVDREAVADWCVQQLESYWTPWWWRLSQRWSLGGLASLSRWAPVWGVLGVTRLHYTISTGDLASRCGAGEWALERCEPQWRTILSECLRLRHRPDQPSLYRTAIGRRRDMLAYLDLLMTTDVRQVLGSAAELAGPDAEATRGASRVGLGSQPGQVTSAVPADADEQVAPAGQVTPDGRARPDGSVLDARLPTADGDGRHAARVASA